MSASTVAVPSPSSLAERFAPKSMSPVLETTVVPLSETSVCEFESLNSAPTVTVPSPLSKAVRLSWKFNSSTSSRTVSEESRTAGRVASSVTAPSVALADSAFPAASSAASSATVSPSAVTSTWSPAAAAALSIPFDISRPVPVSPASVRPPVRPPPSFSV
jgi:hypothetical protein